MIITADYLDMIFSGISHKYIQTFLEELPEDERNKAIVNIQRYLRKNQGYYNVPLDKMVETQQRVTMNKIMKYETKEYPFCSMDKTMFLKFNYETEPNLLVPDTRTKERIILPSIYTWLYTISSFIINQIVVRAREYSPGDLRRILTGITLRYKAKNQPVETISLLKWFSIVTEESEDAVERKLEDWLKKSILTYMDLLIQDCKRFTLLAYKGDPKGIYPIYLTPLLEKNKINILGLVRPKKKG